MAESGALEDGQLPSNSKQSPRTQTATRVGVFGAKPQSPNRRKHGLDSRRRTVGGRVPLPGVGNGTLRPVCMGDTGGPCVTPAEGLSLIGFRSAWWVVLLLVAQLLGRAGMQTSSQGIANWIVAASHKVCLPRQYYDGKTHMLTYTTKSGRGHALQRGGAARAFVFQEA